jgi:DHA1 family multidrug resistance protein-like MFS transporter
VQSWRRTYWAVWFSNLIAAMGMMSILPFFPSHLEAMGMTDRDAIATWTGIVYGAAPLSAAFASPVWGALGDRFGRRLMVLRAMGAIAVFVGLMAAAQSPWQLLGLRIAQGVFSGFLPPSMTLVSTQAPPQSQGRLAGSLQTAMIWGAIIGPLLGEAVRAAAGVEVVYLVVSALAAVSCGVVALFAREDVSKRRAHEGPLRVVAVLRGSLGDLSELRRSRALRAGVVLLFWIQFGLGATNPQIELFVRDLDWFALAPNASTPFSVLAAAVLIAMPLWGRYGDRRGHQAALRRCAAWSGGLLVLHAFVPSFELLLALRVALGFAAAGSGPLAFGLAAAETSADRRGGAFGVVFSARALAVSCSAMVGGWLSSMVGLRGLFALGGVTVLVSLWLLRTPSYPQNVGVVGEDSPNR